MKYLIFAENHVIPVPVVSSNLFMTMDLIRRAGNLELNIIRYTMVYSHAYMKYIHKNIVKENVMKFLIKTKGGSLFPVVVNDSKDFMIRALEKREITMTDVESFTFVDEEGKELFTCGFDFSEGGDSHV